MQKNICLTIRAQAYFLVPIESRAKKLIYDFAAVLSKQIQTYWLELCNCQ